MVQQSYLRQRATATLEIKKWGARAKLRRGGVDRDCWAVEVMLSASEKRALVNQKDKVFLIAYDGAPIVTPPDNNLDEFVTLVRATGADDVSHKIVAPVAPLAPAGVIIYWEIQARGG